MASTQIAPRPAADRRCAIFLRLAQVHLERGDHAAARALLAQVTVEARRAGRPDLAVQVARLVGPHHHLQRRRR